MYFAVFSGKSLAEGHPEASGQRHVACTQDIALTQLILILMSDDNVQAPVTCIFDTTTVNQTINRV